MKAASAKLSVPITREGPGDEANPEPLEHGQDEVSYQIPGPDTRAQEETLATDSHDQDHEVRMDVDSGPATIPSSSVSGIAVRNEAPPHTASKAGDLVSDGIVSPDQAGTLFDIYANRSDHYLYGILGQSAELQQLRSSSSLLLAAVCCVGALHSSSTELRLLYRPCYQRLRDLASTLALGQTTNLDDIRALCIGAFWLQDLSWSLSSLGESTIRACLPTLSTVMIFIVCLVCRLFTYTHVPT